jgi:hypothetical protein
VPPPDFGPDISFSSVVTSLSMIEVMLDQDHIPPVRYAGWETFNQQFSDWLDLEARDPEQKRRSVDVLFLNDVLTEIAEEACATGVTPEQMVEWLRRHRASQISEMPMAGLYLELLYARHLSNGYRWRRGDLVDMLYLSCAAGYCDVVVCERTTAAALANGQKRLHRPQTVVRNLRTAMPEIARRVSERFSN